MAPSGGSVPAAAPNRGPAFPARVKLMPWKSHSAARSLALVALTLRMESEGISISRPLLPGRITCASRRLTSPICGMLAVRLGAAGAAVASRVGLSAAGKAQSAGSRLSRSPSASTLGISMPPEIRERSETLAASLGATRPGVAPPGVLSVTSRNSSLGISPSAKPIPPMLAR